MPRRAPTWCPRWRKSWKPLARGSLGLEAQVGELVLDKTLEVPGAAGRLADFNGKIAEARNDVAQLEAGHQVAQRRAAQAEAARDAKGRRAQLSAMNKIAEARLEAKKILAGYWTAVPKS